MRIRKYNEFILESKNERNLYDVIVKTIKLYFELYPTSDYDDNYNFSI